MRRARESTIRLVLRQLHIANLAVIQDMTIGFTRGLNCFTGQTGAGKSLILGALEVLLGLRSGPLAEMIRPGATEARVSGVFEIHDPWLIAQIAQAADLSQQDQSGEELLITRKVFASGRSSATINGQPATAAMLRQVAQLLVDVHGQHDHQYLLKPSNQLLILDAFGQTMDLRQSYGQAYATLRELRQRHNDLTHSRTLRRQQLELYEFQAGEIDAADVKAGEFDQLRNRHLLLTNVQRIKREAGAAHGALYEAEGAVVERLHAITHVLSELAELDAGLKDVAEQVRTSTLILQETSYELSRHVERLDLDPGELAEIEARLNTLNRMVSKYADAAIPGDDPLATVLAYRAEIGKLIDELLGQNQDLSRMEEQMRELEKTLAQVGGTLTLKRKEAADRLRPRVEAQLKELGMAEAAFEVSFDNHEPDDHEPSDDEKSSGLQGESQTKSLGDTGPSGADRIEMMVRTNPGQPARPLRRIASGGEMSRIMLALKSILAQSDRVSVLVFDEIDANIGGRMGTVIGQKLRQLSRGGISEEPQVSGKANGNASVKIGGKGRGKSKKTSATVTPTPAQPPTNHQILCITHLPQIAAFADRHFRIAKEVVGKAGDKETRTTVTVLADAARVDELAEMLAGKNVTQTTRQQVGEMLTMAADGDNARHEP